MINEFAKEGVTTMDLGNRQSKTINPATINED